jgi:hypothetical protein
VRICGFDSLEYAYIFNCGKIRPINNSIPEIAFLHPFLSKKVRCANAAY